jgi:2'-5' RNA ligase
MRAFLAIELPDDARAELARAQARLRQALGDAVGWTPEGNWHLTLAFLGETDLADAVAKAVRPVCAAAAPLDLALGPLGRFGDRVLWAGLEGPGVPGLVALAGALQAALVPLGFAAEERPYSPHVTLGRVRDDRRGPPKRRRASKGPRLADALRGQPAPAPVAFTAREVVLFESRLGGSRPATYVPHAHVPLGAADPGENAPGAAP